MQDEGPPHAQRTPEQPGFEDDVVARCILPRGGLGRCALDRPVVVGEEERGEVHLVGELDEAIEGGDTRVEHRRPRFDVRDVLEPPGERLQELLLLHGRTQEDARLHHCSG